MSRENRTPVDGSGSVRKKRVPVGTRDILTVYDKEPGFVYMWVNDTNDGNLQRYLNGGYEHVRSAIVGDSTVNTSEGTTGVVSKIVGSDRVLNKPMTAYLMRITQEWYDEDQAAKMKRIDEKEAAMKRQARDTGRYGSVQISSKTSL